MLEIKNTEVFGLERSLQASGNPMSIGEIDTSNRNYTLIGSEWAAHLNPDFKRGKKLGSALIGSGHDNFLSGIDVYYDVKYSLYWTPEFQRYHFNQIISSQSKMHKLTSMGMKEDFKSMFNKYVCKEAIELIRAAILLFNSLELGWNKNVYDTEQAWKDAKYETFMIIISNLPAGFEQWMTIKTNYLQLKIMYFQRKGHRLSEDWGAFCNWCLTLPLFGDIIGVKDTKDGV
jgi:hypothetical protein